MSDKDNAVQQAQIWAQEARTQRAIVLSILRYFGLPERDYEALTLIQEKDGDMRAAMLKARDALAQVTTSETFFRDPRGDNAGPAIDALDAALGVLGTFNDQQEKP
jgi:hypothetical protein